MRGATQAEKRVLLQRTSRLSAERRSTQIMMLANNVRKPRTYDQTNALIKPKLWLTRSRLTSSTACPSPLTMRTYTSRAKSIKENSGDAQKRSKSAQTATKAKPKAKPLQRNTQKTLTQLHFCIDKSTIRTCSLCDFTYTKGAEDDEVMHKAHCARVRQGMDWTAAEEKELARLVSSGNTRIRSDIRLGGGGAKSKVRGRIIAFPATISGKPGKKLQTLLSTINITLSAPDMEQSALQASKAYLFLVPEGSKERIAGCVIAQRIAHAMAIVDSPPDSTTGLVVSVDHSTGLFCSPKPLPTPMGIPRLFVSTSNRRMGIARHLLDAAAETFIHGCPLDQTKGQVAFSQPTGMGQKVMMDWGKGGVRVFEE